MDNTAYIREYVDRYGLGWALNRLGKDNIESEELQEAMKERIQMKEVRVYIPSKDKYGQSLSENAKAMLEYDIVGVMVDCYGGCTLTTGEGAWTNDKYEVVKESMTIVSSYTDDETEAEKRDQLVKLAEWIKDYAKQEAVLISIKPVDEVLFI